MILSLPFLYLTILLQLVSKIHSHSFCTARIFVIHDLQPLCLSSLTLSFPLIIFFLSIPFHFWINVHR